MPQGSERPPAERTGWPADQVRAQIAANNRQLQQARQRARSARVQARRVARLLDSSSPRAAVGEAVAARLEHAAEVMAQEPVVHVRVVGVQERAGQLQQGWSARSAAARADAARARERSRRAREELARSQAGAAAARERMVATLVGLSMSRSRCLRQAPSGP